MNFSPVPTQNSFISDLPAKARLKVLVADDSPVAAKILSLILQRGGYDVITASDGIEAAQTIYHELPDAVLLDIFMPRMNGYLVCRLVKQDSAVSHIPILINTASEGRSAEFWSHHTGADGFLLKGIPPEELLDILAGTLGKKRSETSATTPKFLPISQSLGPEEILSKVCALVDQELYGATVKGIELQTMLASLTEGIVTFDSEARVTTANHFFCALLGAPEAELQNRECGEALGEVLGEITRQLVRRILQNEPDTPRESQIESRGGKITPVALSAAAVKDYLGEIVGAICVFRDITRQREAEALNRLKNDLTDMIVHDLRTPLTSLLTGIESVEMLGDLNADQSELMNISIGGGQILLGMINDLLDISKMENGSMQIARKPVALPDLTERALHQVTALAQAKGLDLRSHCDASIPLLHADSDKLLRTLVNLLSNAIKFTPTGGSITLDTDLSIRPGRVNAVVFSCQDSGEGIPADSFERIFEKFGQVESRQSGRMMSTGLGLTFCKMAVEAHGGRIWVQSALSQGSRFSFAIPTL